MNLAQISNVAMNPEVDAIATALETGDFQANVFLRQAREARGWRQEDLAQRLTEKLGYGTSSYISQIEKLKAHPSFEVCSAIADILGKTVEEIFPAWLEVYCEPVDPSTTAAASLSTIGVHVLAKAIQFNPELAKFDPEQEVVPILIYQELQRAFRDRLSERQRQILIWHFGLDGGKPKSLACIADKLGLSRDRVRQIEEKALSQLRHPRTTSKLRDFLNA